MAGEGKQLVQCLSAVSAYGKEISALCETLNELLVKEIASANLPCKPAGGMAYAERKDETEWIYTDIAYSLPLMGVNLRKNRPEMYLGYQISLAGDGMSFVGNEEPLLHVCFWIVNFAFGDGYFMTYPLGDSTHCLKDKRLIVWEGSGNDWKENQ